MSWLILSLLRLTPGGLPRSSSDVNRLGVSRKSGSSEMFSYAQSSDNYALNSWSRVRFWTVRHCSSRSSPVARRACGTASPPLLARGHGFRGAAICRVFAPAVQAAYGINLISQEGAGQTIAIIDAYDNPDLVSSSNAAAYATSDLHNFDTYYGLPDFGSPGGPTFTKLDQSGGTDYPGTESSGGTWEEEEVARRGMGARHRAGGQYRTG